MLLAAGQKRKAEAVKQEAERVYGVQWRHVAQLPDGEKLFIGRQEERKKLRQLLCQEGHPLVTLTGLGGSGKTALALNVAKALRYQFARIAFVSLESFTATTNEQTLLAKIASGFGLELAGRVTPEAITRELGHETTLLVLDNFEPVLHLKGALERLMQQSSLLSVLVTSREILELDGEHVVTLAGLEIPPTTDDFETYDATKLVLELCKSKGVEVSRQTSEILELCRVVAGLPLALKLAASWSNVLPVKDIVAQLQGDLEFLNQSSKDKERHSSLRKVFDVSFEQLTSVEQTTLSELAVFSGKFSFASVNSILQVSLKTLKRFVERSLLRAYPSEASYDLHPLLEQYLREKVLANSERWQKLQDDHAAYYLAQLARKDASQQRETRERLGKEADNVFAAWRYTITQNNRVTLYDLAPSLETFCDETAQHSEGLSLFQSAVASARDVNNTWLGRMQACCAWLEMRLGQTLESQRHAGEALQLLGSDDTPSRSSCYIALASIYEEAGEFAAARDAFLSELALHQATSPEAVSTLMNLATLSLQLGEYEQAKDALNKVEDISLANGSATPLRLEFIGSRLLAERGEALQARVLLEGLLQKVREQKLELWCKNAEIELTQVLLELGEVERSVWLAQHLLATYDKDRWLKAKMQLVLADAAMLNNDTLQALRYYHESLKTVLPTRSVPALLLRLSRLVKVLPSSGNLKLAARIFAYCKDPKNYRRMSFVDQGSLDELTLPSKEEVSNEWHSLEPGEVALLVVSDVEYILQRMNQGETPSALVAS